MSFRGLLFITFVNASYAFFFPNTLSIQQSRLYGIGGESITSNARSGRDVQGRNAASSSFKPDIGIKFRLKSKE